MLTLGIDPGTAIMGYGLVRETSQGLELVEYGALTSAPRLSLAERLRHLYAELMLVIERTRPDVAAVEELFFSQNARTALAVGHARGIAILAAANAGIAVAEYTPLQVKQAIVGYGRATKDQVQQMVRMLLNLDFVPQPDDAADAIAVAISHIHFSALERTIANSS